MTKPQEYFYDHKKFENLEIAYGKNYIFQQLPYKLTSLLIDFLLSKTMFIGIIFAFSWQLGIIAIITLIITLFLSNITSKSKVDINKKTQENVRIKENYKQLLTSRDSIKETKVYKLMHYFQKKHNDLYIDIKDKYYKIDKRSHAFNILVNFIDIFLKVSVRIYLIYLCYKRVIDLGQMVLLISAFSNVFGYARQLTEPLHLIIEYLGYGPIIDNIVFPITKEEKKVLKQKSYPKFDKAYGAFESIKIKNVSYHYPAQESNAIQRINLEINKSDSISILGYNGSGKTTLSKIICDILTPKSGDIYFNDKNYKELSQSELSKYFGVCFQEFVKYQFSIKENLQLGCIEHKDDDEVIRKAIKNGNLMEFIDAFITKENTILGKAYDQNGTDLSGGQWQKIMLAKSFMGDKDIIILDEPTASIDPLEEEKMLQTFRDLLKGRTSILISHRIAFARISKKIIFMKDKQIVESGTHEELLEKKGYYYDLFKTQQDLYQGGDLK